MKKIIWLFLFAFFLCFPLTVNADKVTDYALNKVVLGTRNNVVYEITDLQLTSNYLIIKGWSFGNHIQNHNSSSSHKYMIEMIDQKTYNRKVYFSNPYNIDKSNLVKMANINRKCQDWEYNTDGNYCYTDLSWSGFEFYIPLSELNKNTEYNINFAINLNRVGETHYFNNGIVIPGFENINLVANGTKYSLNGQFNTWSFIVTTGYVRNREAAGKGANSNRSNIPYCRANDTTLYWHNGETYTNFRGSSWIGTGQDKELWINLGFRYSNYVCQLMSDGDRIQTTMNGNTGSGWITTAFLNYFGEPTTLKIESLENTKINSLKTYTTKKNTNSKIVLNINNLVDQQINITVKYKNNSLYNENIKFIGNKEIIINNLNIDSNDIIKVEVTEPSGIKHNIEASIYVSSEETISVNAIINNINITTPIMVEKITGQTEKKYYESFDINIPHNNISVVAGQGFLVNTNVYYYSDINEIILNNITGKLIFEKQDSSLDFPIINGLINVKLENKKINDNNIVLNIPKIYVDRKSGKLYSSQPSDVETIDGGNKWYIDIETSFGVYDYYYEIDNIGVNLVKVNIIAKYNVSKYLLGPNGLYKIKRVWVPDNLNYIFKKSYSYIDLLKEVGGN